MGHRKQNDRADLMQQEIGDGWRASLQTGMTALKESFFHLIGALPSFPAVILFGTTYLAIKVWANVSQGAALATGVRSAVIGLGVYTLAIVVMDTIQIWRRGKLVVASIEGTAWQSPRPVILIILVGFWAFWFATIVDSLQRRGAIIGTPLLGILPGWDWLMAQTRALAESIASSTPYLQPNQIEQLLVNVPLRMVLPAAILLILGYRWRDMGLSFRNWWVALPFLVLYTVAFLLGGTDARSWTLAATALIYPALVEEFFYRGLVQRSAGGIFGVANGLLLAAVLFALLHFPDRYFRLYDGNVAAAIGDMADVALAGVFYGYGFMRTGSVLPWALVHALSNVAGI